MRIHWLQHVPFEGLGSIESWALRRGVTLTATRLYRREPFPAPDAIDGLVVMGGPMSVHDVADHPWLRSEHTFVEAVVSVEKPVLGICLGAQILARVFGAAVRPNGHREIGWFPLTWTPAASTWPLFKDMPARPLVPHWHGETFDIPRGCLHLARTVACAQQAFVTPDQRVVAFQCHPEMRPEGLESLIAHAAADMVPGLFVQSAEEMLADPERCDRLVPMMGRILDRLFAEPPVAGGGAPMAGA